MMGSVILFLIAMVCWGCSVLQFMGKGFLLNNAYIYASDKERKEMEKQPYYRQSGVVFLLVGGVFFVNGLELLLKTGWLFYCVPGLVTAALLYAILSSVRIARGKKDDPR